MNGRIVVEGGELVGVDVPALVARADAISERMLRQASQKTGLDYYSRDDFRRDDLE